MVYSFFLFFVYFVLFFYFLLFIIFLLLPHGKWCYNFGNWDFLSFTLKFDFSICIFFLVLLMVSFIVFLYGCFYMYGTNRLVYFFLVLFSFVISICGLICFRNSIILTLVFWDYLGISSFFLVLFYNNLRRRTGAMSTVFTNRIGDFCIFLFFNGIILCSVRHLRFQFFSSFLAFILFIASFIKGGQYPFGSWLPKAIAAPTPVSCLVHSRTLVTAGIILIDAYSYILINSVCLVIIFYVGLFTIFFSGFCAIVEQDAKKIVALSTISQIGFCFLTIGCGYHYISFLHIVGHSFFKRLLFVQVGYLIYINCGQQDYRGFRSYYLSAPYFVLLQILISIFGLCGLLFSRGFVTKEYIISRFYFDSFNLFVVFFYFIRIFFTFCYCQRMINLFWGLNFNSCFCAFSRKYYYYSRFFLGFFSLFFIFWLLYNFFYFEYSLNYYEGFIFYFYILLLIIFLNYFSNNIIFELKNKFFIDNYAKFIFKVIPPFKIIDHILTNFNLFFFSGVRIFSFYSLNIIRGFYYSSLLFLSFFIFLFLFFYKVIINFYYI